MNADTPPTRSAPMPGLGRRQFVRLGAGAVGVAVVGLAACDDTERRGSAGSVLGQSLTTTTSTTTTAPIIVPSALAGRRLVIVQMNGGNDMLNTLPPADGRYRDLRPTLAIPEAEVVALQGVDDAGLHPSLAGLTPFWDAGELAIMRGIGFEQPNRSHFVSMDRWWRADDLAAPGWMGRVFDEMGELPPLYAVALGAGAPVLAGASSQPTVVTRPDSFRWVDIDPRWLAAFGTSGDGSLAGQLRTAYTRAVAAVDEFAAITGTTASSNELPTREGGATIAEGLGVAAQLLAADAGTRVVVVSASGFDTHANQLNDQARLLTDLNDGIVAFFESIEAAGLSDDVLLVTTSEFGRRAAENGSGGCDHGAGGLSFAIGRGVRGGVRGDVDLANLLDGDVRPNLDPFGLFTACLDWIGADVERVLGRRVDQLDLLR
ncbi:MAG: DUF1501 domain-containing protein [Actinomycetota bacterium]|nr:DUF1501 domain-containing protein [Actinomycetota bacterium]